MSLAPCAVRRAPGFYRPQFIKQIKSILNTLWIGPVNKGKIGYVTEPEGDHSQDDFRQIGP